MNGIAEFFSNLFSTSEWPARWNCGYWSEFHGWLYIVSELLIWLAYFLIPLIIINYISRKKTALKFNKAYVYFAAFILLCGATHFFDAAMFWIPMYRFNALLRFATAIVSLATVYHLIKILPEAFKQKTNLELESEILRREKIELELAQSNRSLREANHNLEAFAYIASHDLQEPLRKIQVFASMLSARSGPNAGQNDNSIAEKIASSASRMQQMVSDVLALSTISESATLNPVSLNEPVAEAIENLDLKIRESNAVINVGMLPMVKGNQAYLALLFMNLIGNAIKFSKRPPIVHIDGRLENGKVIVTVADNGIGIPRDNYDSIFKAFHRLHSKAEFEGSGIGLAVCRRIVSVHNGNISVESEVDKGTTFKIELLPAHD